MFALTQFTEGLELLQRREDRIMRVILPQKKDFEVLATNDQPKKQNTVTLTGLKCVLDGHQSIGLQMCTFHYYEIPLLGRKKPLFINFTYQDQTKMKFYVSSVTSTPNRFNFELCFQRKSVLRYTLPGEEDTFIANSLYMAIFAQQASVLQIRLQFGSAARKQIIHERPETAQLNRPYVVSTHRIKNDIVIANASNLKLYEPEFKKAQLTVRRVQSAQRLKETLVKKEIIDKEKEQHIRLKFAENEKRKILKEIMRERNQIQEFIEQKQAEWFILLKVIKICKSVRTAYFQRVTYLVDKKLVDRRNRRSRRQLKLHLTQRGDTLTKRTIFDSSLILQTYCKFSNAKIKAAKMLHSFLQSYGQIGEIVSKMHRFKRNLYKVIECYRNYRKRVNHYITRITGLFNRNWNAMYQEIQKEDLLIIQSKRTTKNIFHQDEIKKVPYIDVKVQLNVVVQHWRSVRNKFRFRLQSLKVQSQNKVSFAQLDALMAAQGLDKQLQLYTTPTQQVIRDLIYNYMLEKRLIQSVLVKK